MFEVKVGIYDCLDKRHLVEFFYWDWKNKPSYVRYWFQCFECQKSSGWIYAAETKGFDVSLLKRQKYPKTKYAQRIGGLPCSKAIETVLVNLAVFPQVTQGTTVSKLSAQKLFRRGELEIGGKMEAVF